MLGYELLRSFPGIFHFVTTRHGGYSRGNYATFNCTRYTGDDPQNVARNCELLCRSLPEQPVALVIPGQIHQTGTRLITEEYLNAAPDEQAKFLEGVDALLTRQPGVCLCISTADCIPLLFYDPVRQAVAAAHAGWRGTVKDIAGKTVYAMQHEFGSRPENIYACIGPGISQTFFEVGDEVYEAFRESGLDQHPIARKHPQSGKWHLDLAEANRFQLLASGLQDTRIELAGICSYAHTEDFFSARRMGLPSGRTLSGIMIRTTKLINR